MSADCPTCGEMFDTKRGMKVHHSRSHGERLAEKTCPVCEESFASRRSDQQFCSTSCSQEKKRETKVDVTCACCYKPFRVRQWRAERSANHYCSNRCRGISNKARFGVGDTIHYPYTRPKTDLTEFVRRVFIYEGHSADATYRIVTSEFDSECPRDDVEAEIDALLDDERNVRNRLWALSPEDLGLSPLNSRGESA